MYAITDICIHVYEHAHILMHLHTFQTDTCMCIYIYIHTHIANTHVCIYTHVICANFGDTCVTHGTYYIYILCVAISHHFAIAYLCIVPYNELETTAPSCAAVLLGESGYVR